MNEYDQILFLALENRKQLIWNETKSLTTCVLYIFYFTKKRRFHCISFNKNDTTSILYRFIFPFLFTADSCCFGFFCFYFRTKRLFTCWTRPAAECPQHMRLECIAIFAHECNNSFQFEFTFSYAMHTPQKKKTYARAHTHAHTHNTTTTKQNKYNQNNWRIQTEMKAKQVLICLCVCAWIEQKQKTLPKK